jgi:hypothetical protein
MRASQPAFDHYRAWLPSLASMGGRCATSLRTRVTEQSSPATLRQEAIDMSNLLLSTLGIYEQRVAEVRASLSGTPQPAPHRPGR